MHCDGLQREYGSSAADRERGFILVTALVLIAIITILGVAASYKAVVGAKVSKSAGDAAKALEIANAGLNHVFWVWNARGADAAYAGYQDLVNTIELINGNTPPNAYPLTITAGTEVLTSHMYAPGLVGETLDQIDAAAGGSFDTYAQTSNQIRIYEYIYDANGVPTGMQLVPNNRWGKATNPQVAVWVTSYRDPGDASAYPYGAANAGCVGAGCRLVVYALARVGEARRLAREVQGVASQKLVGVSAMTNAPSYGNWSELCAETDPPTNTGSVSAWNNSLQNTVIEVTQAPYLRDLNNPDSNPSGTAIISNTDVGGGGKGFRHGTGAGATLGASFEYSPNILYAGHGSTSSAAQARANLASAPQDNTAPYDNLDNLPANVLPHNLIRAPLIGSASGPLKYFSDSNAQLFDLDAYRWAAEQFTCQDPTSPDGVNGNGLFCSRAEALRNAVDAMDPSVSASAPVTGRLTVAEFEYNVNYSIPMFGFVRVMIPATSTGTSYSCTVNGAPETGFFYNVSGAVATMTTNSSGAPDYDGTPTTVDSNGVLDGTARVIVYGSILFDYFKDDNGNTVFDPRSGESLLNPLEASGSYMKIEFPLLLNPVLPRGTKTAFPTADPSAPGGIIVMGAVGNPVNLASPTGGYFPMSEALLVRTGSTTYADGLAGTMRLMTNTSGDGLVDMANRLRVGPYSAQPGNAATMFANERTALKYYYDLMVATADQSDSQAWPIAPFPATLFDNFYIGQEDKQVGNNDGDRLHLLFPSGYMHGWKVALAALNLKASEWNSLLDGINTLAAVHAGGGYDYGSSTMPKGSPFNPNIDAGFSRAFLTDPNALIPDQNKFFYVESGSGGYPLLTSKWRDIPVEMYVGGLLDMHAHSNINGIVYTPGPLEWEPGNSSYGGNKDHLSYINGAIITGFGAYLKNKSPNGRYVLVYDPGAVDNVNTRNTVIMMRRFGWQELK